MPLHRTFPKQDRHKIMFTEHEPLYIYIDNLGGWNVDTRFIGHRLQTWIEESFEALFNEHFPILTVPDVLKAGEAFYGMFLLHVTLTKDASNPAIVMTYYDKKATYYINSQLKLGVQITCDAIISEMNEGLHPDTP